MLIKAILILKRNGSCRFYRIYQESWSSKEIKSGLISFVSSVTTITIEFGEKDTRRVTFGENEIIYEPVNNYILAIVKEKDYHSHVVTQVINVFHKFFSSIKRPLSVGIEENKQAIEHERRQVSNFAKSLNLIVNKKTNVKRIKTTSKKKPSSFGLVMRDLDVLIANEDGQPLYLLITQSLPYDAVLLVAFISAILNLSDQYELGNLTEIETENILLFIKRIEKAFAIVITTNKEQKEACQTFTEFLSRFSNEWIKENTKDGSEIYHLEKKREFEDVLKLVIETETWEKHLIKQNEIKAVEDLEIFL